MIFHTWSKQTMSKKAMELALEALEPEPYLAQWYIDEHVVPAAIAALKEALKYDMDTGRMIETVMEEL